MCGRCACARDGETIQRACAFRRRGRSSVAKPAWISANAQTYFPSYNLAPQSNTPVIVSGQHEHIRTYLDANDYNESFSQLDSTERVVQVMKWGLVPHWHKGTDARSFTTILNNCRYDGMFDKPSFRNAIAKRQRCVVLADGFYEWQREIKVKEKKAFYIYPKHLGCTDETRELLENESIDSDVCLFQPMLTMAGYFDIWRPDMQNGMGEALYSYTIITVDATENFSQIHHRMPAVLESQDAVSTWLDPQIPTSQAAQLINPTGSDCLSWHPVSSLVNNVRNKSAECIVKVDHSVVVRSQGSQSLLKWFTKSPAKKARREGDGGVANEPSSKKIKSDVR